mgnify:FL=1
MATDKYSPKEYRSLSRWSPNPAPVSPEELPDYLFNELNRLGDIIFNVDMLQLSQTNVAPGTEVRKTKPRDGDIRYADGTNWNPGSGEGIYAFFNEVWSKL